MAENSTAQSTIQVKIVTPDGTVFDNENVTLAVLTTQSGELGIMANRIPLVAALKIDRARFHIGNNPKDVETFTVNGGFAEFDNNVLSVIAPSAEDIKNIDVNRAKSAKERAEQKAKAAKSNDDRRRAEVALARAINRINASNRPM